MKYLFVLGRDEDLSIKELEAYFDKFEIIDKGKGIVLAECPKVKSIEKLGGVVKIAEVLTQAVDLDEVEYALDHDVIFNKSSTKVGVCMPPDNSCG